MESFQVVCRGRDACFGHDDNIDGEGLTYNQQGETEGERGEHSRERTARREIRAKTKARRRRGTSKECGGREAVVEVVVVVVVMVVMMVVVVVGIGRKEGRECKRLVFLFASPAGRTLTA